MLSKEFSKLTLVRDYRSTIPGLELKGLQSQDADNKACYQPSAPHGYIMRC